MLLSLEASPSISEHPGEVPHGAFLWHSEGHFLLSSLCGDDCSEPSAQRWGEAKSSEVPCWALGLGLPESALSQLAPCRSHAATLLYAALSGHSGDGADTASWQHCAVTAAEVVRPLFVALG